jgi:hypothetical protein
MKRKKHGVIINNWVVVKDTSLYNLTDILEGMVVDDNC